MTKRVEDEFFAPLDPKSRKPFHELLLALAAQNDPRCAFDVPETPVRAAHYLGTPPPD